MQQPGIFCPSTDTVGQFGLGIGRGVHAVAEPTPQVIVAWSQQIITPGIGSAEEHVVEPHGIEVGAIIIPAAPVVPVPAVPTPVPLAPNAPATPKSPAAPAAPEELLFLLHAERLNAQSNTIIVKLVCFSITTLLLVAGPAPDTSSTPHRPPSHCAQNLRKVIGFLLLQGRLCGVCGRVLRASFPRSALFYALLAAQSGTQVVAQRTSRRERYATLSPRWQRHRGPTLPRGSLRSRAP
jgi:hypothetical protein